MEKIRSKPPTVVTKEFKCTHCFRKFSAKSEPARKAKACPFCMGMAKATGSRTHKAPVWKEITEKVPFCPECNNRMSRVRDLDIRTMFNWLCWFCNHAC